VRDRTFPPGAGAPRVSSAGYRRSTDRRPNRRRKPSRDHPAGPGAGPRQSLDALVVAGAAALVQATHPDVTADQIAYPLADRRNDVVWWGLLGLAGLGLLLLLTRWNRLTRRRERA